MLVDGKLFFLLAFLLFCITHVTDVDCLSDKHAASTSKAGADRSTRSRNSAATTVASTSSTWADQPRCQDLSTRMNLHRTCAEAS